MLWDLIGPGAGWTLAPSPSETERFGVTVARLVVRGGDPSDCLAAVSECDANVIIARYPSTMTDAASVLARTDRTVIDAGALVYYAGSARDTAAAALSSGLGRQVHRHESLTPELAACLADAFADYPNHYGRNPLLQGVDSGACYVDWAYRTAASPDSITAAVWIDGTAAAVAVCARHGPDVEVAIAGTARGYRRRGCYRMLMAGVAAMAHADGAERLLISTQAWNTDVQAAWMSLGMTPIDTFETVHLVSRGRSN